MQYSVTHTCQRADTFGFKWWVSCRISLALHRRVNSVSEKEFKGGSCGSTSVMSVLTNLPIGDVHESLRVHARFLTGEHLAGYCLSICGWIVWALKVVTETSYGFGIYSRHAHVMHACACVQACTRVTLSYFRGSDIYTLTSLTAA
jgi:hypothetical protein